MQSNPIGAGMKAAACSSAIGENITLPTKH